MLKIINKNWWTEEEKNFLCNESYNYSLEELAVKLNRSTTSISSKLGKMRLRAKVGNYKTDTWSHEEINFIKSNHLNMSNSEISAHLNRSIRGIAEIKTKLGLSIQEHYNILNDFQKTSPELAYILGFLFADGCLHKFDSKSGGLGKLLIHIQRSDACYLEPVLLKVSPKWSCIDYKYKDTTERQTARFTLSDTPTYKFLYHDLELKYKNEFFSQKIFDFLPEHLHCYFWRGYMDGDGCVLYRKDRLSITCSFAGPVDMDWAVLANFLSKLNIKYSTGKYDNLSSTNKIRGRWSSLRIDSSFGSVKFLSRIYKDFPKDNIGFTRKFIRYVRYLERRAISPYYSRMVKNADLLGV